jgi:hypothetical protein
MVAIVVALAVPVSQLRTRYIATTCCCPDPSRCHCPDHKADQSKTPAIRACHKESHEIVSPQPPPIATPIIALAIEPARAITIPFPTLSNPHRAPAPDDPYGPS